MIVTFVEKKGFSLQGHLFDKYLVKKMHNYWNNSTNSKKNSSDCMWDILFNVYV